MIKRVWLGFLLSVNRRLLDIADKILTHVEKQMESAK